MFRPEASTSYDLERILAETKVKYWRFDPGYIISGSTQLIYDAATDTWNGFQSWGAGEPNDFQFGNPSAVGEEQWAQFWSQPNPGEFSWNDHRSPQKFYMEIPIGNSINGNHVSCFGGNDGYAKALTTGGIPPYNYL